MVRIATSSSTSASLDFWGLVDVLQAGCWLEVMFDSSLSPRLKLFANGIEVAGTQPSGTMPLSLLAGDAANSWLASLTGVSLLCADVAHYYVGNDIPSASERAALRAYEQPLWPVENLYPHPRYVYSALTASSGAAAVPSQAWHIAGDILVMVVETRDTVLPTPSGWNAVPNANQTGGSLASGTVSMTRLQVFWRRAVVDMESAPMVDAAVDHKLVLIMVFRGCVAAGDPIDVSAGASQVNGTLAPSIPGATTTVDNCLVVAITARADDASVQSNEANASLTDLTKVAEAETSTGDDGIISVVTGVKALAGAYAATTATFNISSRYAAVSFALKPR